MKSYVVILHDMPVAVTNNEERARKMLQAIREQGSAWGPREAKLCELEVNEWPEEWAGKESR